MKRLLSIFLSVALLISLYANVYAADTHKIIITAEKTIIYESASIESEKLITVKKDHILTAIGSTKSFWKVQFKKKNDDAIYAGYVLKKDTEEVSTAVQSNQATNQSANQTATKSTSGSATTKSSTGSTTTKSSSGSSSSKTLSTVYWTPNGEVYHSIPNCRSLARSKTIRSGTIAQSGKHKACRNCVR